MSVTTLAPPRSPLFTAALQLLAEEPEALARLVLLRDAFPRATIREIADVLRETAILFLAAGVTPPERRP